MTLGSRREIEDNLTGGKILFSRAAKQGLPALGRENNETHCFGSDKNAVPVVLVSMKPVHQLRPGRKRETNLAGEKAVTSEQMREVHYLTVPDLESVNDRIYTVGLKNVVYPVGSPIKFKVPNSRYTDKLGSK